MVASKAIVRGINRLLKQAEKDKDQELQIILHVILGAIETSTLKRGLASYMVEFAKVVVASAYAEHTHPEPIPMIKNEPWYCNVKRVD